jgi:hypothetical protein
MAARTTAKRSRFTSGLSRQIAARGGLEQLYRRLSDHWTTLIQELYPVWIVIGPGLASPAHIECDSRTVYLDSDELLGTREQILAGLDRYRILVCFGVAFHEVGHGKHTLRFVIDHYEMLVKRGAKQLALDRELLEEPRMEAHMVRDYPPATVRGRFIRKALRACVASILLPRFHAQAAAVHEQGGALTRDMCGRAMTYLAARTHYGIVDPKILEGLEPLWEAVLGIADIARLHDLYARVINVGDGELDALDALAREYREIIGPPDPPQTAAVIRITRSNSPSASEGATAQPAPGEQPDQEGQGEQDGDSDGEAAEGCDSGTTPGSGSGRPGSAQQGEDSGDGSADGEGESPTGSDSTAEHDQSDGEGNRSGSSGGPGEQGDAGEGDRPSIRSLTEALEDAGEKAQAGELRQLNEDVNLDAVIARAAGDLPKASTRATGTGAPTGRMPVRDVDRPPMPDEIRAAALFASRIERARTIAFAQIDKRTPGGRFHPRQHVRALAQRQHGRPVTAHAWSIERRRRNPIRAPHVIFIADTSASMAEYEYALGPIAWIIDTGLRIVGGRMATGLFGNAAELLSDGRRPMRLVPAIRTGGGTAFAGDAMDMCTEVLDMEDQSRPRLAYILSDGGWYDTHAGMERIRWLASLGVPTIHISLFVEPLSVLAARISVIRDPADALNVVAADSVALLQSPRAIPVRATTHG